MDFFEFIDFYKKENPNKLRLAINKDKFSFDPEFAIIQIACRQKYKHKLRNFLSDPFFTFPDEISGEQASHQAVAKFHSSLIGKQQTILDLTAGLGIDALTFALNGNDVWAIEINETKASTLLNNTKLFNLSNLEVIHDNAVNFLETTNLHFDIIFIDPSRRSTDKKRLYNLHDCNPDVIGLQNSLLSHASKVLIKASPLLDISQTIKDFPNISKIRAIGVKGECKEILIELNSTVNKNINDETIICEAINLDENGNIISSFLCQNDQFGNVLYASSDFLKDGAYILEPSAMIMKLAPWGEICKRYEAFKFGKNSNIFISFNVPTNFPGRVTQFQKLIKKQDRKSLKDFPASVVSKNYPLSSEEIRKELKLKEGDQNFIYATKLDDKPLMFLSKSLS